MIRSLCRRRSSLKYFDYLPSWVKFPVPLGSSLNTTPRQSRSRGKRSMMIDQSRLQSCAAATLSVGAISVRTHIWHTRSYPELVAFPVDNYPPVWNVLGHSVFLIVIYYVLSIPSYITLIWQFALRISALFPCSIPRIHAVCYPELPCAYTARTGSSCN